MGGSVQGKALQLSRTVSTIAGVSPGFTDGIGTSARFNQPYGITSDGTNLYIADRNNHVIRKIVIATQEVTTLAGNVGSTDILDGIGTAAHFANPACLTTDGNNLYVVDASVIRKIVIATGAVTTIAGDVNAQGYLNGIGTAAKFNNPSGITTDGTNLYIADSGNTSIRKIVLATTEVTTLAGTNEYFGSSDGVKSLARFGWLGGLVTDGTNLYVADSSNSKIRKVDIATGEVTTLAGLAGSFASIDGVGINARFGNPVGITKVGTNLYITDSAFSSIRRLDLTTGAVTTLAGSARVSGFADGIGTAATFTATAHLTSDGTNLFIAESNCTVRKVVLATTEVTTFAGKASSGFNDGADATARFNYPNDITTDGLNLYVTDTFNYVIRKIELATGMVSTLAGTALSYGTADGVGAVARFGHLKGITTDKRNLYVTDYDNYTIRKIVIATGEVTTLAGTAGVNGSDDGVGAAANFNSPY